MTLPAAASASRNGIRTVAPRLIELTETLVYPDIWERPGLSKPSAMSAAKVVKHVYEEAKA